MVLVLDHQGKADSNLPVGRIQNIVEGAGACLQ